MGEEEFTESRLARFASEEGTIYGKLKTQEETTLGSNCTWFWWISMQLGPIETRGLDWDRVLYVSARHVNAGKRKKRRLVASSISGREKGGVDLESQDRG